MNTINGCANGYKECRRFAGYTQEEAAHQLNVSVRMLQMYEAKTFSVNGDSADDLVSPVPEPMVAAMKNLYGVPMLSWWHLKHATLLGRDLPDVQLPSCVGDCGFQTVLAREDATKAEEIIREIFADRVVDASEIADLMEYRRLSELAAERHLAAVLYTDTYMAERGENDGAVRGGRQAG